MPPRRAIEIKAFPGSGVGKAASQAHAFAILLEKVPKVGSWCAADEPCRPVMREGSVTLQAGANATGRLASEQRPLESAVP